MNKEVEYEDWNRTRRLRRRNIKRVVQRSENEYDTYYEDNDRER